MGICHSKEKTYSSVLKEIKVYNDTNNIDQMLCEVRKDESNHNGVLFKRIGLHYFSIVTFYFLLGKIIKMQNTIYAKLYH